MKKKLIIILSDSLKDIVNKGELVSKYYNPKNFFDEIHFLLINQKKILIKEIKFMTGKASCHIHYVKISFFQKFFLLFFNKFSDSEIIKIIKNINPKIIRCYNINIAVFLSYFFFCKFKINYIVSLHYDLWNYIMIKSIFFRAFFFIFISQKLNKVLRKSFVLLPVYNSAVLYLKKYQINNYKIQYNFINTPKKKLKKSESFFNLLCLKRQNLETNPVNIIYAVKDLKNVRLTLIGDGTLHSGLVSLVKKLKIKNKVKFYKKKNNLHIIKNIKKYDATIFSVKNAEFSKGMIESMSAGIPIIINTTAPRTTELNNKFCLFNDGTVNGYKLSIIKLMNNNLLLKKLSFNALKIYKKKYPSNLLENKQSKIYKKCFQL